MRGKTCFPGNWDCLNPKHWSYWSPVCCLITQQWYVFLCKREQQNWRFSDHKFVVVVVVDQLIPLTFPSVSYNDWFHRQWCGVVCCTVRASTRTADCWTWSLPFLFNLTFDLLHLLHLMWSLHWPDPLSHECGILGCQKQIFCRPPKLGFKGHK